MADFEATPPPNMPLWQALPSEDLNDIQKIVRSELRRNRLLSPFVVVANGVLRTIGRVRTATAGNGRQRLTRDESSYFHQIYSYGSEEQQFRSAAQSALIEADAIVRNVVPHGLLSEQLVRESQEYLDDNFQENVIARDST